MSKLTLRIKRDFAVKSMTAMAVFASFGAAVVPAGAQSLDYGALQQLFGEPVTSSAIGTPQRARDVPANIEIVTADDIRRSGASDIPGVLSHVLGVDVLRWSALGADVSLRGYNSPMTPRLLVLIDGRQVYIDDFGRTEWAALPVELAEIRQIEVVKGPNSALFGFNAAGGVINIITFNPLYDKVNTASVTLGTQGYRGASAVAADHIGDDIGIRLSAGGAQSADFQSVRSIAGNQGLSRDTSRDHVSLDMHWRINAISEFELQASHSEDQRVAPAPPWLTFYTHNQLNSLLGRYTADTNIGVVTATACSNWSYTNVAVSNGPAAAFLGMAPVSSGTVQTNMTVATLQDVFNPAADHTVRLTAEYRHSSLNEQPESSGVVSYDIASIGAMWNWNVTPTLSLTAATRADLLWLGRSGGGLLDTNATNSDWSRQIIEPSYNIGAVWHPTEPDRFRVTISRGVQLPSLIEFAGVPSLFATIGSLDGSPIISPTVTQNYEIDWDHDLPRIDAQSRVGFFYQTIHNIQSTVSPFGGRFTPTGFVGTAGNIADSSEIGAEFAIKGSLAENWRWRLSYSPRLVQEDFKPGASTASTATADVATTPKHVVDASLGWSRDRWEIDSFLRFQSSGSGLFLSRTGYAVAPIGPVVVFDARVGYQVVPGVTLSLSGQNVLFTTIRQTAFSKVEQQLFGSVSVRF